ncbi:MAG: Gfo/Idh/MocA family oxidoreductase [Alsobacter sp.]
MGVRIAVVGAGVMGADHARIVAEDCPGASLQVVCDASPERARSVADACGASDATCDPYEAIRRADVDAVIVASPDSTHAPLSLACLAAGKPVLCEKPLSQSSVECLSVVDAEAKAGRKLVQLGFMRRFDQSYVEMKAALDDGSLGRALLMHNFHRNVETPASDFTADMAITNSAPHEFDVARFVLACDCAGISAFQPAIRTERVGPVFMVLEMTGGQLVNVEVNNNAAYGYDVRGELVGETGSISLSAPVYSRRDAGLRHASDYARDWRPRYAEAYRRQNKAFVRFVQSGDFPRTAADAWDGYCATAIAEAGVRSLREGRRVPVETAARPAFYAR